MKIQQVSVFLENKPGRLASVGLVLKEHRINIRALTIADTSDFGVLRLIVTDPEQAAAALRAAGFTVRVSTIVAVEIDDREGVFYDIMKLCDDNGLNVEYTYSFVEQHSNRAIIFLRFEDPDRAIALFQQHGFKLLTSDDVRKI
jgi:hypothetical protein